MNTTADVGRPASAPPASKTMQIETIRAADMSYPQFLRSYAWRNLPVVIEGAVDDWPALAKWKPDYFKSRFGKQPVTVAYGQTMPFDEFIDAVMASSDERPGPYMHRLFLHEHLPELLEDVIPQNAYSYPRRYASPLMPERMRRPDGHLKLLIGGPGSKFPVLHFDGDNAHAAITEIYGDKEMILFAPEDAPFLYVNPNSANNSLLPDPHDPDLRAYPLAANATPFRTIIRPGQMIFIPSRWWHSARPLTPSVSLCMNMMDGSNWAGYVDRTCELTPSPARRLLKRSYLAGLGKLLAACEVLQDRWPRLARWLWLPQRLSPASAAIAPEPSARPIKFRLPTA